MTKALFIPLILFSISVIAQPRPEVAFTLKEKDLIPEGITYDAVEKNFFVGSIYKRKVLKITPRGVVSDFIKTGQDGLLEVLGMHVDQKTRRLWVCNNPPEQDTVTKVANIHVYDLTNGTLIKHYQIAEKRKHLFNDVVLSSTGDAYITDSEAGSVYVIRADKSNLEEFVKAGTLRYPNGLALSPDEKKLLVSTAAGRGIVSVDLQTAAVTPVPPRDRFLVIGIDGMYRHGNTLIGVQNITFPESIVRFEMNNDFTSIEKMKLVVAYDERFQTPTTGVIAGEYFYFIANSQLFQLIGNKGQIKNPDAMKDTFIMRVKL